MPLSMSRWHLNSLPLDRQLCTCAVVLKSAPGSQLDLATATAVEPRSVEVHVPLDTITPRVRRLCLRRGSQLDLATATAVEPGSVEVYVPLDTITLRATVLGTVIQHLLVAGNYVINDLCGYSRLYCSTP